VLQGDGVMKIAVIGTGHMGSWFIRELFRDHDVAVYDRDRDKSRNLEGVTRLDNPEGLRNFKPEILLNAVSLENTIPLFESVEKFLPPDCVLMDITSIKGDLSRYYSRCGFKYASCHPMFGPNFTDLKHLKEENAIIISQSDDQMKLFLNDFFSRFNIRLFEYSFDEHDELMAYSLTLPFASSIVFSACVSNHAVPGTTFSRHRKIAQRLLKEDDFLLSEVLFNPSSLEQLENICHRLEFLKHVIKARDYDESKKFFDGLRKNLD
jgi:prephenate dehydrogenase